VGVHLLGSGHSVEGGEYMVDKTHERNSFSQGHGRASGTN
jgi:hypothetical protein